MHPLKPWLHPLKSKMHPPLNRSCTPLTGFYHNYGSLPYHVYKKDAREKALQLQGLFAFFHAETVNDPVEGYLLLTVSNGNLKFKKTAEDGKIAGISFTIAGDNFCENVTTDENGELQLNDLVPGVYTVTENAAAFYEPQQPQSVTVKAGQTSEVSFSNQLKRGALEVAKTAEDGFVQGVTFRLSGTADCGQPVDVCTETDESGIAVFENIPIGSNYTMEEVDVPGRYIVPVPVYKNRLE